MEGECEHHVMGHVAPLLVAHPDRTHVLALGNRRRIERRGLTGNPGQANYAAAKAGLVGFAKSVAREVASRNITINAVAPGEVNTPMLAFGRDKPPSADDLQKLADETIPMQRLAEPEEIGRVVAFLVSDAASYMTGAIVTVDAGYTAR